MTFRESKSKYSNTNTGVVIYLTILVKKSHVPLTHMSSFIPRYLPDFAAVDAAHSNITAMVITPELQNLEHDGEDIFSENETPISKDIQLKISTSSSAHKDAPPASQSPETITLLGRSFPRDEWTNITPRVADKLGKNLHLQVQHNFT